MDAPGDAGNRALARGTQEIALEFDGGEAFPSAGKIEDRPVAAGRICQSDDRRGVQVSVGREQFGTQRKAARQAPGLETDDFNPDQARQVALSAGVELFDGDHEAEYSTTISPRRP